MTQAGNEQFLAMDRSRHEGDNGCGFLCGGHGWRLYNAAREQALLEALHASACVPFVSFPFIESHPSFICDATKA